MDIISHLPFQAILVDVVVTGEAILLLALMRRRRVAVGV